MFELRVTTGYLRGRHGPRSFPNPSFFPYSPGRKVMFSCCSNTETLRGVLSRYQSSNEGLQSRCIHHFSHSFSYSIFILRGLQMNNKLGTIQDKMKNQVERMELFPILTKLVNIKLFHPLSVKGVFIPGCQLLTFWTDCLGLLPAPMISFGNLVKHRSASRRACQNQSAMLKKGYILFQEHPFFLPSSLP